MVGKLNIQLRYSDSDQMGVIYHANYFSFFEQGRTAFLKDIGFDYHKVEEDGVIFPVRDVSCTYLKAMRFGENITLTTKLHNVTKIKLTYYHELVCKLRVNILVGDSVTFRKCLDSYTGG